MIYKDLIDKEEKIRAQTEVLMNIVEQFPVPLNIFQSLYREHDLIENYLGFKYVLGKSSESDFYIAFNIQSLKELMKNLYKLDSFSSSLSLNGLKSYLVTLYTEMKSQGYPI